MAKIMTPPITPLDEAVEDFLSRITKDGNTLNYIAGYTFVRDVNYPYMVIIKLYADEELAQFGVSELDPEVEPDDTATIIKRDAPTEQ